MPPRRIAGDHDKIIALLTSVADECVWIEADDHGRSECRHCLAVDAFQRRQIRTLLAAFLADVEGIQ